jgi:hypothetical protein
LYGWPEPYNVRSEYGIFGREITKYLFIYGACILFWPTLSVWLSRFVLIIDISTSRVLHNILHYSTCRVITYYIAFLSGTIYLLHQAVQWYQSCATLRPLMVPIMHYIAFVGGTNYLPIIHYIAFVGGTNYLPIIHYIAFVGGTNHALGCVCLTVPIMHSIAFFDGITHALRCVRWWYQLPTNHSLHCVCWWYQSCTRLRLFNGTNHALHCVL